MNKLLLTSSLALALALSFASTPASAATPPDSCFAFDAGTGTITGYYDHEANNPANPACTRDVDIPSTIDGTDVTSIDRAAFSNNRLTSVIIPDSVVEIGPSAFDSNELTTVTIPDSVTTIGNYAFGDNRLTSINLGDSVATIDDMAFVFNSISQVNIPDSVTTIGTGAFGLQSPWGRDLDWCDNGAPCFWSDDASEVQEVYDSVWYAKLYTQNPSNPNNLQDDSMSEEYWRMSDANDNGVDDSNGGHIINPASASVNYRNATDSSLQQALAFTGVLLNQSLIPTYMVKDGPAIPHAADPYDPTPSEIQAMQDALSAYYRLGDSVTITPPAIPGYITPPTQTFVLGASDNEFSYVYGTEDSDTDTPAAPGETDADSDSKATEDGSLADTGMNVSLIITVSSLMIIIGTGYFIRNMKQKGIKL